MDRLTQLIADVGDLWLEYKYMYLGGMWNTIRLAFIATLIGCVIGFICGILQTIPHTKRDNPIKRGVLLVIRVIVRVYVEVLRGTPMVLQAVFFYYGLPYFTNNTMRFTNMWVTAIFVVSINTGAYMAETVRGGIISIDKGQEEGAKAIGMNHLQTMTSVILPQAFRNIIPQIGNNFIINIKDTSVLFIISFTDFFAIHRSVTGATYEYFPSATIEMAGYLTMTLIASFLLRLLERFLAGNSSYELVKGDALTMAAGTYNAPGKKKEKAFKDGRTLVMEERKEEDDDGK